SMQFAGACERGVIVCHNDAAAWNLVIGERRWAFIDWDVAGPRPSIWDIAYCAIGVIPIGPDATGAGWPAGEPVPVEARLAALADGYGMSAAERAVLPDVIVTRINSSYTHLRRRAEAGIAPWDRLWREGHGDGWAAVLEYAQRHAADWRL